MSDVAAYGNDDDAYGGEVRETDDDAAYGGEVREIDDGDAYQRALNVHVLGWHLKHEVLG